MAGIQSKSVSFDSVSIGSEIKFLTYAQLEVATKWLSCNGDFLGVGPTLVFASAAALFLYHELEATIYMSGDHPPVSSLEKTLVSTMVLGILALMVHIWVCAMRFFQYYLDSIIKDSPDVLLQLTTAGLLGYKPEIILGPLTKFLRYQQPQIHITVCWFLSLCYADYVRKHYCQTFNMPYLEQWQSQLHERVSLGVHSTVARINSFVSHVNMRLRGFTDPETSSHSCQPPTPSSTDSFGSSSWVSCKTNTPTRSAHGFLPRDRRSGTTLQYAVDTTRQEMELCLRNKCRSTDLCDAFEKLHMHVQLYMWSKCGDSALSTLPTLMWAVGSAALSNRILEILFRRFLFRRVPLWEVVLHHLLFIWMVIYSLHFWVFFVQVLKIIIEICFDDLQFSMNEVEVESQNILTQCIIWFFGAIPLAVYIQTRPRRDPPPLMIWIASNPWHRREMGPYGYYLNRPLTALQSQTNMVVPKQSVIPRRAFSDSKIMIKEPQKKKRYSKSV